MLSFIPNEKLIKMKYFQVFKTIKEQIYSSVLMQYFHNHLCCLFPYSHCRTSTQTCHKHDHLWKWFFSFFTHCHINRLADIIDTNMTSSPLIRLEIYNNAAPAWNYTELYNGGKKRQIK